MRVPGFLFLGTLLLGKRSTDGDVQLGTCIVGLVHINTTFAICLISSLDARC